MLKLFGNDTDTYIAESVEDVLDAWREHTGDDYIADDYGEKDDWFQYEDETFIRVMFDENDEPAIRPEEAIIERDGKCVVVEATAANWAKSFERRGFLSSTEF